MYTVETLLNERKIEFQPKGSDFVVKCLSPDHDDDHPSMHVDRVSGIFNCWSCGYSGNLFHLWDAPKDELSIKRHKLRERITEITAESIGLQMPKQAVPFTREYRGIRKETYAQFEAFTLEESGWEGRVWFPLKSVSGKIVAFIGRDLSSILKQKYKVYPKHAKVPLFHGGGLDGLGTLVLVEGPFDMLNLWDKGLTNVASILGANTFNKAKLDLLKLQGLRQIVTVYDGDTAGQTAAKEVLELCERENVSAESIDLPDGLDPGDMSLEQVKQLKELIYNE